MIVKTSKGQWVDPEAIVLAEPSWAEEGSTVFYLGASGLIVMLPEEEAQELIQLWAKAKGVDIADLPQRLADRRWGVAR